jgi:Ca2+-binding EF-hand superfamily protein
MSKKKLMITAGILAALGAVAAVSAQGHRGGRGEHGMMGGDGFGRPGMFNRSITGEQFDTRTRERFAGLDKNSDGFIDAAEIEAGMASRMSERQGRMGGQMGAGQMGERMIRMFDENKDGKVTKDEFDAYVKKRFAEADLNNDGKISDDDLPPMMRGRNVLSGEGGGMPMGLGMRHGGMGGSMGGQMGGGMMFLRGADANKDGVVTLDEALAHAGKRFALMDKNKDGAVDKADFEAMRKETADYRVKHFIHQYGADKDGKVSREQFNKLAKERFARADVNGDGTLSRDELPGRRGFGGRGGHHGGQGGHGGPGFERGQGGPGGMMGPGGRGPRGGEEE